MDKIKNICVLCYDKESTIYTTKCIHYIFCKDCLIEHTNDINYTIKKCPICNTTPFKISLTDDIRREIKEKDIMNMIIHFGKYKDLTVKQIIFKDKKKGIKYLKWISKIWKQQYEKSIKLDKLIKILEPIYTIDIFDDY